MFHSLEANGCGERSTLGELSHHGQRFGNMPIGRELRTEHVPDNPLVDDLIKIPVNRA
jgi:hypothetical protein